MKKLSVCLFCKSKNVEIVNSTDPGEYGQFYVYCNDCCARGPLGDTKKEATDKWMRVIDNGKN